MTHTDIIKRYVGKRGYKDHPEYQETMIQMRLTMFTEADVAYFKNLYADSKDLFSRNQILQAFVLQCLRYPLKDFFLTAFKKERYLDMRLTAVRGYAAYASEKEIIPLMKKFMEILAKRPESTPYNYQEYEILRSPFGLPYLVKKYGYSCFTQASELLEKQYADMPDLCKGFFTLDEHGMHVPLLPAEEVKKRLDMLFTNTC